MVNDYKSSKFKKDKPNQVSTTVGNPKNKIANIPIILIIDKILMKFIISALNQKPVLMSW